MPKRTRTAFRFAVQLAAPQGINVSRAEWAKDTLEYFAVNHGEALNGPGMLEQNISDLLCNLAHFCDATGLLLSDLMRTAEMHYDEETDAKGRQFDSDTLPA